MIKGITFDFDNTLYDYDVANNYALDFVINDLSHAFNIEANIIKKEYLKINKTIKSENNSGNKFNKMMYFKLLFETFNIPLLFLNDYINLYQTKFVEKFQIFDGVIELFEFLKSQNIVICILSNNIFSQQYYKLKESNLLKYVDFVLTSDECGNEKPSKHMFTLLQDKLKMRFDEMAYVGDNFEHDIEPSIDKNMLTFWFNKSSNVTLNGKIIQFGSFYQIMDFFKRYFQTISDLIFLSKYFGQSSLNVQGPGGNLSIKLDDLLFIKSSGFILGNVSYDEGYCLVNNKICENMRQTENIVLSDSKIFGHKIPSMETYFHSFMKKYTVHLHFTLSNICFCSNKNVNIGDFKYNYAIIDYYNPGIELANQINKYYNTDCDIYFLKNHGIIITSNEMKDIFDYYEYIFNYFNKKTNAIYANEYASFMINQIYHNNNSSVVVKRLDLPIDIFKPIQFCFPDMIVFITKIGEIENLNALATDFVNYNVILYDKGVFCVAENITKLYALIEILESYKFIYLTNKGNLSAIKNVELIRNMPQEQYRNA